MKRHIHAVHAAPEELKADTPARDSVTTKNFPMVPRVSNSDRPRVSLEELVSDEELARLVAAGHVTRAGVLLTTWDGQIFTLQEAVRVLGSVPSSRPGGSHGSDPFGFTGLVDTVGNMLKRGFVMSSSRVALGRRAYDVEYGWLAFPVGSADKSGVNPKVD